MQLPCVSGSCWRDVLCAPLDAHLCRAQVPNPELGPLEQRVSSTYEEALFTEDISPADTQYWFTEPQGGFGGWCGQQAMYDAAQLYRSCVATEACDATEARDAACTQPSFGGGATDAMHSDAIHEDVHAL